MALQDTSGHSLRTVDFISSIKLSYNHFSINLFIIKQVLTAVDANIDNNYFYWTLVIVLYNVVQYIFLFTNSFNELRE